VVLVPLAEDPHLAIGDLSMCIDPTTENGCTKVSHALAHHVTATSNARIMRVTGSQITPEQLTRIRQLIAVTVGIE